MPKISSESNPKIAIIGGSGFYDPGIFKLEYEVNMQTPYGLPSAPIGVGDFLGKKIAFLTRHGKQHQFPPHKVPQRANLFALKKMGVERMIGICAVGSLREDFKPGELVVCDQFIDFTKDRDYTFYNNSAVHISLADPFCLEMRSLAFSQAKGLNIPVHQAGTYFCVNGPRFSTRAESRFFKNFADVIGMTLTPEAILAREMGFCYLSLAMVTDFDVWQEVPVTANEVIQTMEKNTEKIKKLLVAVIPQISEDRNCPCKDVLKTAEI